MFLVLCSLFRSGTPGVKEWSVANLLGIVAFVLYAFGRELPPLIAYEVTNGSYAAAMAAMLAGFQRFFARKVSLILLGTGIACLVAAIAVFHYVIDSYALRTVAVAVFQAMVCLSICVTILRSRKRRLSGYPYLFTVAMTLLVATGHGIRSIVYLARPDMPTSLLEPSGWNLFFLGAGSMVLPILTLGAIMIVHDKIVTKAQHAANRDFLTGAWSRRAFFEIAEREIARARRTGRPLSLLVIDADHFKMINDTWGHAAGDEVLVEMVAQAEQGIRSIDSFARVGGEEFALLLPETDRSDALMVAERLRADIERHSNSDNANDASVRVPYTVSIGLAVLRDADSLQSLVRRADAALYQAKASGRNRVVCESLAARPENRAASSS